MAKKLKTPLQMRNGVAARTMSEFREAFDYKLVLGYLHDGRLKKWLSERGYEAEAERLENLHSPNPREICEILGVPYNTEYDDWDSKEVVGEHSKKQILKGYTNDEKLLSKARCAAFNQKDLDDLIEAGEKEILLVSKEFDIPLDVQGITYIGIRNSTARINSKNFVNFNQLNIHFEGDCKFDEEYKNIVDKHTNYLKNLEIDDLKADRDKALEARNYEEYERLDDIIKQVEADGTVSNSEQDNRKNDNIADANKEVKEKTAEEYLELAEKTSYNKEKFECYLHAAEMGNVHGQYKLGQCYLYGVGGLGLYKDINQAAVWLIKAAQQGNEEAIQTLKTADVLKDKIPKEFITELSINQNVEVDVKKISTEILEKMAEQGEVEAQMELANRYYLKENYELALRWLNTAASLGNSKAQLCLARCYMEGKVTDELPQKAFEWYLKAAEQGEVEAQYQLGGCYFNGYGVREDDNLSFEWTEKAAKQGHKDAMYSLASLKVFEPKLALEKRLKILEALAEQNYEDAVVDLGFEYMNGNSVDANYYRAKEFFDTAIKKWNNSEAMFGLGLMMFNGLGQGKDEQSGVELITKAAMYYPKSSAHACDWLAEYYDEDQGFSAKNAAKGAVAGAVAGMGIFSIAGSIAGGIGYGFLGKNKRDEKKAEFYRKRAEEIRDKL